MKLNLDDIHGASIIRLQGRLDVDSHTVLKDESKVLVDGGAKKLLIDFDKVDFIDT